MTRRTFIEDLERSLRDEENAKDFGEAMAKVDIAVTLAEARRSQGVTQEGLASRLGITQSYVAKLERGDANPTIGIIGRLLGVLGLRLKTGVVPLMPSHYEARQTYKVTGSTEGRIEFEPSIPAHSVGFMGSRTQDAELMSIARAQ